jgi:hypothetical protein
LLGVRQSILSSQLFTTATKISSNHAARLSSIYIESLSNISTPQFAPDEVMDFNSIEISRPLDRFSVVTLIFFVLVFALNSFANSKSIVFVIRGISIPLPSIRISKRPPRELKLSIPLNMATAPVIIAFILKATQCIPWSVVRDGITGGSTGVQPFNIMILFFSLAYLAMSLGILL